MRRAAFGLVVMLSAGCSSGAASPSTPPDRVELTIFAAASLKGALEAVKPAYEAAVRGPVLTVSTDSSSTLATQIEQGAPADVFLSADTTQPERLVEGGFAAGDPVAFATNTLTIIVPADGRGAVRTPADMAMAGLRIIAAGDEVPITRYSQQVVDNLATQPGYPAGFAAAYAANVVTREDNVKAIVAKIELGEGDAGIVYLTDAVASNGVRAIDIPEAANVPASYAGVVIKVSTNQAAANAFLDWLVGAEAQSILASFGFQPPA
jgi:molybdate transport system substrate-binding protein